MKKIFLLFLLLYAFTLIAQNNNLQPNDFKKDIHKDKDVDKNKQKQIFNRENYWADSSVKVNNQVNIPTINAPVNGFINQQNSGGLKFSKAIFITDKADGFSNHIVFNIPIKVEKDKVWNITSSQAIMIKGQYKLYKVKLSFWINDQAIYYYRGDINGSSIWLPEGTYQITVKSVKWGSGRDFMFYLSGVEYTVQK